MLYFQEEIENNNLSEKQTRWLRRYESEIEHVPRRNIPFKLQSLAFIELIDEEQPNIMRKLSKKFTREEQIKLLYDIHRDITLKKGEIWRRTMDHTLGSTHIKYFQHLPDTTEVIAYDESHGMVKRVNPHNLGCLWRRYWNHLHSQLEDQAPDK